MILVNGQWTSKRYRMVCSSTGYSELPYICDPFDWLGQQYFYNSYAPCIVNAAIAVKNSL